jgi:FkbM family methyltransferase
LLAFEPQRAIFQILCANLALNGVLQVEAHWAAIGNRDGDIRVPLLDPARRGNFGGVSLVQTMAGEAVRLVTLDSFALPQCHFLKIDCEGMEFEAIDGARATLARHAPIVYAENDRAGKAAVLIVSVVPATFFPDEPERPRFPACAIAARWRCGSGRSRRCQTGGRAAGHGGAGVQWRRRRSSPSCARPE